MNREEIMPMAREAGFDAHDMASDFACNLSDIERFAALVAAAEREACAQIAEDDWSYDSQECGADVAADIAASIRARGQE